MKAPKTHLLRDQTPPYWQLLEKSQEYTEITQNNRYEYYGNECNTWTEPKLQKETKSGYFTK